MARLTDDPSPALVRITRNGRAEKDDPMLHARQVLSATLVVAAIAVTAFAATPQVGASDKSIQPGGRFPAVTARNLERRAYRLPAELEGKYNVVVIAYRRQQQADVNTWMPFLNALEAQDKRVRWYELPTISGTTGFFMGWMIDRGMRRGIPDIDQRRRTITLYLDKTIFRRALRLPQSNGVIHVLLIDKAGRVLYRADGPYTPVAAGALRDRLKALR